ncbi:hypothetical protein GCM10022405_25720 [Gibbsiella dentisursi]|uniref:Uncharacterized protein n=1 Tax=Gibbsiella dentisursi TaxID=796890 RepID=A0ABP7LHT4_9GAMM
MRIGSWRAIRRIIVGGFLTQVPPWAADCMPAWANGRKDARELTKNIYCRAFLGDKQPKFY